MGYFVDRVVICDAYAEPDKHYRVLPGGRSKLAEGRRPSMRFLASAKDTKGGIAGIVGRQESLFEELGADYEQQNDFVNGLREEVRAWRNGEGPWAGVPYDGTKVVTRRLLEWWFERDEERKAVGTRFFFCQREAIEAVIYLYEVKNRHHMPETNGLLRYALKLATGTGKTVVMALLVTWATLHKRKVAGSTLSANFLVLAPNLTVRDRVSGAPRGDGLDPSGAENLYDAFDTVPPEYRDDFHPNVVVRNWQSIPLEGKRDDWLSSEIAGDGRFVPASVLWALQRRAKQDPNAGIRRFLKGWRDVVILNDEAHHVYGEKRTRKGEDPEYIKWSKIIERIGKVARIALTLDLSATPWYGSGSPKPEGTLFEWLVCDFSVYDAFESGLVKVVRLPDPSDRDGSQYIDLWDLVGGARTKEEYLSACKSAIVAIYSNWKKDFEEYQASFGFHHGEHGELVAETAPAGPAPVLLVVASDATRASWLFEHLTRDYPLLRNNGGDDPRSWVTIQVDSKVFDADKGKEEVLRAMVNTVGRKGRPGERVRCIVSVQMLTEGWDVKSVTHILGLRAFGSPLLTEQIIGRGLRRTDYDVLNEPLEERGPDTEETVDAFGIPFVGFPVEKRRRPRTGGKRDGSTRIEKDSSKAKYRVRVPNVRSWGVGVSEPLSQIIRVRELPGIVINPHDTPTRVPMKPVVGNQPDNLVTIEEWRSENPLLASIFVLARDLYEATNPGGDDALGTGPTFDELLEVAQAYVGERVTAVGTSQAVDVGIYKWRKQVVDILETTIRSAGVGSLAAMPILSSPGYLDTENQRGFLWPGPVATGRKSHNNKVPCHNPLEQAFADFLDAAKDVERYVKNERFGFSVTYYENNRPRQYYPDFVAVARNAEGQEINWVAETKGEIRPNTAVKRKAAELWCEKMSTTKFGAWRYLFVPQRAFERARAAGVATLAGLAEALIVAPPEPQLRLFPMGVAEAATQAYKTMLPLYSLNAAAGYFGDGEAVEPEGWVEVTNIGKLNERMFVARAVGHSMEPQIHDGDYCVFSAKPAGSRQGKVLLVQYRGPADPDTGGAYTVKRYSSEKIVEADGTWRHARVTLAPLNPDFAPIILEPRQEGDVQVVAEFLAVLGRS